MCSQVTTAPLARARRRRTPAATATTVLLSLLLPSNALVWVLALLACSHCVRAFPAGSYGASTTLSVSSCTNLCSAGYYGAIAGQSTAQCSGACTQGYYCTAGSTSPTQVRCVNAAVLIRGCCILRTHVRSAVTAPPLHQHPSHVLLARTARQLCSPQALARDSARCVCACLLRSDCRCAGWLLLPRWLKLAHAERLSWSAFL